MVFIRATEYKLINKASAEAAEVNTGEQLESRLFDSANGTRKTKWESRRDGSGIRETCCD